MMYLLLTLFFCGTLVRMEAAHRAERRNFYRLPPQKRAKTRHLSPHRRAVDEKRKDNE